MVDSRSGSNLLYLPLDKLMQQGRRRRRRRPAADRGASAGSRSTPRGTHSVDIRSRDGARSRDRDGR